MKKNIIKMNYPTRWWGAKWREAMPAGNGEVGIGVYGEILNETVMITHTDLWWKTASPELPDLSHKLPEIRKELLAGRASVADRILPTALEELDYNGSTASPLPLCDLKIHMPTQMAFKNYSRELDMETGEITVSWLDKDRRYERNAFVSRKDNVVVYRIREKGNIPFDVDVALDLHDTEDAKRCMADVEKYLLENAEFTAEENYIYFSARNDDDTDFGAVGKVVLDGGSAEWKDNILTISETRELLLVIKTYVKGDRNTDPDILKSELSKITADYDILLKDHVELHRPLFLGTTLDLMCERRDRSNEELLMEAYKGESSNEILEKMWAFGRYLLMSASKEGGNPCHLYGLWCGDYRGFWTYNMFNENVQMIYWQALSGNMPELLLPVFDYLEKYMDDFRTNAKNLYGCRGIFLPAPTTPDSGLLKHRLPHIIHWTAGAGWMGQHYYRYYEYTQDTEFLKQRAIPFMKETALFYEDFFVEDENGKLMSFPSVSPENMPSGYLNPEKPNYEMETTINATMDFAVAKELLTNLIKACEIVGDTDPDIAKWKDMLSKIPEYQINEDGAIREWMHEFFPDNYHHRHLSHIYPVFPGNEINKFNNPELYKAFVTAFNKRLVVGLNQQTGWSLAHLSNCYARIGEGDNALNCIDYLMQSCVQRNFISAHNDISNMGIGMEKLVAPVQIDANMGITSAVNEMLVQSDKDNIYILPALPARWNKGRINNILTYGGVLVSVEWDVDLKKADVTLISQLKDYNVNIVYPSFGKKDAEKMKTVSLKKGEKISLNLIGE